MRVLPTETIVRRGEPVTINASDFDPNKHTRWDDHHRHGVTLFGTSRLPAVIEIGGVTIQLGDVVAAAFTASSLSIEQWNALPEADRDTRISTAIDVMHAEAATRAAPRAAPTRASDGTDLGGLTKPQIRDWAAQRGLAVTVDIGAAKADLIAAALAADAAPKAG